MDEKVVPLEEYFQQEHLLSKINRFATDEKTRFVLDFSDFYTWDSDLAVEFYTDPSKIGDLSYIVRNLSLRVNPERDFRDVKVVFKNLPYTTPLRKIDTQLISNYVQVEGMVVKRSAPYPYLIQAKYRCAVCDEEMYYPQTTDKLTRPSVCRNCEGRKFIFLKNKSMWTNSQVLTVQEAPEKVPPGQIPRDLTVQVTDDLVDAVRPGDRAIIVGVMKLKDPYRSSRVYQYILDVSFIEAIEVDDLRIEEEDEQKILALADDESLMDKLIQSTAPSIHGYADIKESLLLQLAGGVPKHREDINLRGNLNIALIGDPSTAKSQMLVYSASTAMRGIVTTGKGSTAAGLTYTVVRDQAGNFTLEAGALVLADNGLCAIDEFEKMRQEDREAIHYPMEQQQVPVAKGGIVTKLNARTAILAAANPVGGRYNPYQNVVQNINLEQTIISRFDLIWILLDKVVEEKDETLATHILGIHMNHGKKITPPVKHDLLRKYIAYSKRFHPTLSEDAAEVLKAFYKRTRSASLEAGDSAISITVRQLESSIRLAEARARLHMRNEVTVEDAEAVIGLMTKSLKQVGIDPQTGELDIDILMTGIPNSKRRSFQKVAAIIRDYWEKNGEPVTDDILFDMLAEDGVPRTDTEQLISMLIRDGSIYSPRPGYYRMVST